MINDYILSIVYIIFFLSSLYFLANTIFGNIKRLPERIVYAYLTYKFFVSLAGCITQLLRLPFWSFCIFMVFIWIGLYSYGLYKKKNNKIKLKKAQIKEHFKQYGFINVVIIIIMFFSLINIQYHWFGNHLDDGYYINKIADLVHGIDTYSVQPATGLKQDAKFSAYTISTWEIESAFYVKIFHIDTNIFTKFALAFVSYWIISITIIAFIEKLMNAESLKKYKYQIQFIPIATVLFVFQFDVLSRLINLISGWQFGNAIYYGSMTVRMLSIFLLLLPIIDKHKISFKDIIMYGITSFVLITQSSVALPVIIITAIAYLLTYLLFENKNKVILIIVVLLLIVLGIILPNVPAINARPIVLFEVNSKSIIFYVSIIAFLLGYLYKNENIRKINTIILFIFAFMYIPELNDITELAAVYDFVEGRFWTGTFYTVIILAFAYAFIYICKKFNKKIVLASKCIIVFLLVLGATLSFYFRYGKHASILELSEIVIKNPRFMPMSTVKLGNSLEKITKDKKTHLYVLTPDWVVTNKTNHSLAVLIRQYAPNSSIISAVPRYGGTNNKKYSKYKQEDNELYKKFLRNDKNNYKEMQNMLKKYPINCLVDESQKSKNSIQSLGFNLENKVCAQKKCYYIYYKEKE